MPKSMHQSADQPNGTPCCPPLDCSHEELVAYIRSMKGGERVMEMGGSGMAGMKGTVEIRDNDVLIRWDHAKYADTAGVMVTSFTGGARIIQTELTPEQRAILHHTAHRAANGHYCGGGPDMDRLVELGLMTPIGSKACVPDPYFTITPAGRAVLTDKPA